MNIHPHYLNFGSTCPRTLGRAAKRFLLCDQPEVGGRPRCRSPPSIRFSEIKTQKSNGGKYMIISDVTITSETSTEIITITATTTINLRDFYAWYALDELLEVSQDVAEALLDGKRYDKNHERSMRRNKVLSLDADDGTATTAANIHCNDNPEAVFEMKERFCRLCYALNSLPAIQGRRVEAHFLLGKSIQDIAKTEGVSESSVKESINRGLKSMRKNFSNNFHSCPAICP